MHGSYNLYFKLNVHGHINFCHNLRSCSPDLHKATDFPSRQVLFKEALFVDLFTVRDHHS